MPDRHDKALLRPPALRPGDRIGVIAPSSPQRDDERLRDGINFLRGSGYEVIESPNLWKRYGYLAGSDRERLDDLNGMIADDRIRMIIAGRGGYGATRILGDVDYDGLRRDPKIVVGFSDVTALNLAILATSDLVTFSGAMPGVDLWKGSENDTWTIDRLWECVRGNEVPYTIKPPPDAEPIRPLRYGGVEGRLIPVNLTLLATLCGSHWLPDLSGSILLLEEIGEEVYRLDRLFSQLENSGILNQIVGLAFGRFTGTDPRRISIDPLELEEVLEHYVERAGVPSITGIPYGHVERKLTLPVGVLARLDSSEVSASLTLLESGVV